MDLPDGNQRLYTHGVIYKPYKGKFIKCYVDDKFDSVWDQSHADNAENVMSRMGYVIKYSVCTVLFCSKLQT